MSTATGTWEFGPMAQNFGNLLPVSADNPLSKRMREMRIVDYKTGEELRDVGVSLTAEEAGALIDFLKRLVDQPAVATVHLTEVSGIGFEREVAFHLEESDAEDIPTVA